MTTVMKVRLIKENVMQSLKKVSLLVGIAVLSLSMNSAVFAQPDKQSVETIDVQGEKTTPQLKRAFKKQQMAFIELYNSVNTDAQFDVICKWRKFTGSQIARKLCEPRYMIDFRALTVQT